MQESGVEEYRNVRLSITAIDRPCFLASATSLLFSFENCLISFSFTSLHSESVNNKPFFKEKQQKRAKHELIWNFIAFSKIRELR